MLNVGNSILSADCISTQAIQVNAPVTGDGTSASPIGVNAGSQPTYTTLWSTNSPFNNMYSFTLSDSIDNYDEYIVYGSANRDNLQWIDCQNRYVVKPGTINMGGSTYFGKWSNTNTYVLMNGTEMWISGTSGYVTSSYFFGQNNNTTAWGYGVYTAARTVDVHPYKIVGVKYQ